MRLAWSVRSSCVALATFALATSMAMPPAVADPVGTILASSQVQAFGSAPDLGGPGSTTHPIVSMASHGATGYWLFTSDGQVFPRGDAGAFGSIGAVALNKPIVDASVTPGGSGYWMVAADGGIFSFGNAPFLGSLAGVPLRRGVVAMATTPSGQGYFLVSADGGVFTFGDAVFAGSLGGQSLAADIVDLVLRPAGDGYWLLGADGSVYSFGAAPVLSGVGPLGAGSSGRIVGGVATASGDGLWLASSDGGIFTLGSATFHGSGVPSGEPPPGVALRSVAMATTGDGSGYWLTSSSGLGATRPGERGPYVTAIQRRLSDLHFFVNQIDGVYGRDLAQAVMAFQKYVGLARTGVADAATVDALSIAVPAVAVTTSGTVIEIDKTRQIMFVVVDGQTQFVFNVSTGSQIPFRERSPITGGFATGDAITYNGRYRVYYQRPEGWRQSDLGRLWRPKYFNAGIAVHGSFDIPGNPASHGCVRVSLSVMNVIWFFDLMPIGREVWVYGG